MRNNPLINEPKRHSIRTLLQGLQFYAEAERASPGGKPPTLVKHAEELRKCLRSALGESDVEFSAEHLSYILESEVWQRVPISAFKKLMKQGGFIESADLSALTPVATVIYLHLFAIPRKKGIPALPDKKFGWIGIEKAAQDPKAAILYLQLFVAPVEEDAGELIEPARKVLYSAIEQDPSAVVAAAALFSMPLTERAMETVRIKGDKDQVAACEYLLRSEQARQEADGDGL